MYHQYADKEKLFLAVLEEVEEDVTARLAAMVGDARPATPADALHAAADAWLEIAGEPEVRQLVLLDAPSVLGWAGFREISQRYGLGMAEQLLAAAIQAGQLVRQPLRPLASVLMGALDEAAMTIANADDLTRARREVRRVVHNLIDGLLRDMPGPRAQSSRGPRKQRVKGRA